MADGFFIVRDWEVFSQSHSALPFKAEVDLNGSIQFLDANPIKAKYGKIIIYRVFRTSKMAEQRTGFTHFERKPNPTMWLAARPSKVCSDGTLEKELDRSIQTLLKDGYPKCLISLSMIVMLKKIW